MYRKCRKYLEENSKAWEKRKIAREQEQERQEQLEKARFKTRNPQIRQVEKNIEKGIGLMTENDRKKFIEQEKQRKLLDLKATKQDLWRLRNHEKKIPENKV